MTRRDGARLVRRRPPGERTPSDPGAQPLSG